jgi:hypothetical protein
MTDICEDGCRAARHDRQHGTDLGPKQMWNREARLSHIVVAAVAGRGYAGNQVQAHVS